MADREGASVDLTNCDREPIHLLGAVQPFGFLVAVSRDDWSVARVSANVHQWLDKTSEVLLGQPLEALFCAQALHAIRGHLQTAVLGDTTARIFGVDLTGRGRVCDVAVHLADDVVIIECENPVDEPEINAAALVRGMMARLSKTRDLRSLYRIAVREMRALIGFDRVMVYRLDHSGCGEVIAESARAGLESYLGLHYPASDIPQQARVLYERNWLRIISDVNAEPVRIEPELDQHGNPLDLSMSVLRSVSAIHIEYLRNMGVEASMSVSILRDERLWGLFACHHYAPRHIGSARRTAAELFGHMFSLLLETRESKSDGVQASRGHELHQRLATAMTVEEPRIETLVAHLEEIARMLETDGIGLSLNGEAILKGLTPGPEQFSALVDWLRRNSVEDIRARNVIGEDYPPGREFADRAAGMLVVPLSRPARDYLIFFRQEATRTVNWAGDPAKPAGVGPLGERLTPRRSFELWKETVRGHSMPWTTVECSIVESLRVSLLEIILRMSDTAAVERRRSQERQDLLIAELNHRVRNILGLIRGVITQSRDSAQTLDAFTAIVGGRIQALARAHDQITADQWGPASLANLIAAEAGAYLGGKAARVVVRGRDALVGPEAFTTIALVIHEMITNSAKYGALSDSHGRVDIATSFDPLRRLKIEWSEHGGPPVKPPSRRGFGSTVIERSITHDLKGEARLDFALAGLRAEFIIPAAYAQPSLADPPAAAAPSRPEPFAFVAPDDVLLVEDNIIIALDAEEIIRTIGVATVRTVGGVADAMKAIADKIPDFGLLDVNLGNETSFEIAARLMELGVPFAFTSGYGEQIAFPERFATIRKVRKPYSVEVLADVLAHPAPRADTDS